MNVQVTNVTENASSCADYQWQFNGVDIPGATFQSLYLPWVQPSQSGTYTVVVSSPCCDVTSSNAILTVFARPANDLFANRIALTGLTNTATGWNVGAFKEGGEPDHAGNVGGNSVWWTWTAPITATMTLDTTGSSFDTLLAVYTGTSVGSLTLVTSDNNGGSELTSRLQFQASAGVVYQFAVDGLNGTAGTIVLHLSPDLPPTLKIAQTGAEAILSWPASATNFILESTAAFSVNAQWHLVTNGMSTAGDRLLLTNQPGSGNLFYRLRRP